MKKFRCVPIAIGLPIAFWSCTIFYLGLIWFALVKLSDQSLAILAFFMVLFSSFFGIFVSLPAVRRVEFYPDFLICKGLFPQDTFEIRYQDCNVGMDYHRQNRRKVWWIYLCYGSPPQYKRDIPANRINSVKIAPGFVKIMYSDEVYNALIEVLPKKQKTALVTARRCAGFKKQGNII